MNIMLRPLASLTLGLSLSSTMLVPCTVIAAENRTYIPPITGAPTRRTGAGTRSAQAGNVSLMLLAPMSTGAVTQAQPILYWHTSKALKSVQFTLQPVQTGVNMPAAVQKRISSQHSGLQKLDFAQMNLHLQARTLYEWSIALPKLPGQRQRLITSGTILYQPAPSSLTQRLVHASMEQKPLILAQSGYWYDAFDTVSMALGRQPNSTTLDQLRDSLLSQQGLPSL